MLYLYVYIYIYVYSIYIIMYLYVLGRKKLSVQYPVYLEENVSASVPEVG